ncbi:hypothetical protein OPT61_g7842 [Boeremia exigua]|uniref:Uncharacterized protein n=1 Tax=Boeremia exigua TaxID=749465 RepID=A0ACC2I0Q8_9PLEO|nr:hypothetical protein OPT61_g7842 [Boeremia exigua]
MDLSAGVQEPKEIGSFKATSRHMTPYDLVGVLSIWPKVDLEAVCSSKTWPDRDDPALENQFVYLISKFSWKREQ